MKYQVPKIAVTGHSYNKRLCSLFAKGCGGKQFKIYEDKTKYKNIATYGVRRGTGDVMKAAEEYWYIDHGYLGCTKSRRCPDGGYYRITRNALIHSGEGNHDWDRFNQFDNKISDWKKNGSHVVICPPSAPMIEFLGIEGWIDNTIQEIRKHTDRKIIISQKGKAYKGFYPEPKERLPILPIDQALEDAWVLATDHSNTMVTALMRGIPIICTNANRKIGSFEKIEAPVYKREWLKNLAYNQWTQKEIRSGQAWEELNQWG